MYDFFMEYAPDALKEVENVVADGRMDVEDIAESFSVMPGIPQIIADAIREAVLVSAQNGMKRRTGGAYPIDVLDFGTDGEPELCKLFR